uniref:Uncharacterized protein n=1 Tax=Mandrillus leucophaeus TaxID=9568 RepID=A0A2K5Y3P6_MANLE
MPVQSDSVHFAECLPDARHHTNTGYAQLSKNSQFSRKTYMQKYHVRNLAR